MSKGEPFEADLVVVRRNPWMVALAFLPALVPAFLALAGMPRVAVAFMVHGLVFTAVALSLVLHRNPRPRLVSERVLAHDGAVRVGAGEFHAKGAFVDGLLVPRQGGRPRVVLKRRGAAPRLEIEASDTEEGRRLLRALGFDASQRVASFKLAPLMMVYPKLIGAGIGILGALCGLIASMTRMPQLLPFVLGPLFLVLLVTGLIKRRLDVGADGLLLQWFGTRQFVPHSRIASVSEYEEVAGGKVYTGVDLVLEGAERLRMVVGQKGWSGTNAEAVAERIREAREEARHGGAEVQAALLARGSRGIKEWVTRLRGIGAGANASLRAAPVAPERLWRIVEDGSAEPAARAGAAVALGAELDDERRAHLLDVSHTIAAPRLRVAIEHVAEGRPDAELEEALAQMEGVGSEQKRSV